MAEAKLRRDSMKYVWIPVVAILISACGLFPEPVPDVLSGWQATSSLTVPRSSHAAVAHNGYLYVLGGSDGTENWIDHVEYAPILADGTVGSWSATTAMPYPTRMHEAFVHGDNLYVVGGNGTSGAILDDVIYAPINADGSLGAWTATTGLPSPSYEFALVVHNDTVVVLGGGFTRTQTVEYATINADGSVGAWQSGPDLLQPRQRHAAALHNGTVFLIGGDDGTLTYVLDVEYSTIGAGGAPGAWAAGTPLSASRMPVDAAVVGDYLFAIGARAAPGTVEYSQMMEDGTMGPWEPASPFYSASLHAAAVSGSYIYVTGGYYVGPLGTVEFALMQR